MAERLDSLWDSVKRGLQDGAAVAMSKAEELTQLGRARLDIAAAKTRLGRLQSNLGELVYDQVQAGSVAGLAQNPEVQSLCDEIRSARDEVVTSEATFERVKAEQEDDDEERVPPPSS